MANRLLSLVVLAVATGAIVSLQRQSRRRPAAEPGKAKPVPVQTWEGEGGALPATGAQMGPDPAVTTPVQPAHADADADDLTRGGLS